MAPSLDNAILLLGEDPSLDLILAVLERAGTRAVRASNPFEAVLRFSEQPPQGAIIHLDTLDPADLDLIRVIKETSPETRVVLTYSLACRDRAARGLALGADAHLLEPFYPGELRALLALRPAAPTPHPPPPERPPSPRAEVPPVEPGAGRPSPPPPQAGVEELAGGVAHEINNPLTVIQGWAEILLAELEKGDPRQGRLRSILEESDRIRRIVDALQAFAGRPLPQAGRLDLNEEIRGFFEEERRRGRAGGMRIELDLAPDLPAVRGESEAIRTVLHHLTRNARRATSGTGTLRAETLRAETPPGRPGHVVLLVSDDGPGVPAEHTERIFLPFFSGFTGENCAGLGLAACRGILTSLGGTIELDAPCGAGARFRLELPLYDGVPSHGSGQ